MRCPAITFLALIGLVASPALVRASSSFKVTDLGPGTPTYSADSGGQWIVTSAEGGRSFAFAPSTAVRALPPSESDALFGPSNPGDLNDLSHQYHFIWGPITNDQGLAIATYVSGVYGHEATSWAVARERQADGSWGEPMQIATGMTLYTDGPSSNLQFMGLNKLGQVLLYQVGTLGDPYRPVATLFDPKSGSTDITSLAGTGWSYLRPMAIDDLGRILATGEYHDGDTSSAPHGLILTPTDQPDPTPVPEPVPLLVFAVLAGVAATRIRRVAA
jgi:hypothetical protein